MSLINQMLKDLEKREKSTKNIEISLSGLQSAIHSSQNRSQKKDWMIGFLFIIGVSLLLMMIHHQFYLHRLKQMESIQNSNNADAVKKIITDTVAANTQAALPTLLTGMTLQLQEGKTELRILLNQDTLYTITQDPSRNELTLTLDRTNLVADLPPIDYQNSAIRNIEMLNDPNGDLKIILLLKSGITLNYLNLNQTHQSPELQINLSAEENALPTNENNKMFKRAVVTFNAEQQYTEALNLSARNKFKMAEMILTALLEKVPDHYPARELLIKLLIQTGNETKAADQLEVGLQLQPDYPAFLMLKAQLLVNQGKINNALTLLQSDAPSIEKNPEYHAFIAALYQRQGQTVLAEKLYERLIVLNPSQATWWIGLGVALESNGENESAKEAYSHAMNSDKLNPELKAFLDERLSS